MPNEAREMIVPSPIMDDGCTFRLPSAYRRLPLRVDVLIHFRIRCVLAGRYPVTPYYESVRLPPGHFRFLSSSDCLRISLSRGKPCEPPKFLWFPFIAIPRPLTPKERQASRHSGTCLAAFQHSNTVGLSVA